MSERVTGWIKERIAEFSNIRIPKNLEIITDTTEFMDIYRGQVLSLDGAHFLVTGNVYESRFGLRDEPKYWVKKAVDLETGKRNIVKMVFNEEFRFRGGGLQQCRKIEAGTCPTATHRKSLVRGERVR